MDTHLVVLRSRLFDKVKVKYIDHTFQKTAVFGDISVSLTQLVHSPNQNQLFRFAFDQNILANQTV